MSKSNSMTTFNIADVGISIHSVHGFVITDAFMPFVDTHSDSEIDVVFREKKTIEFQQAIPLFSNIIFSVYEDDRGYYRVFHDHKEDDRSYAISRIYPDFKEEIDYLKDSTRFFCESQNSFSHIALEELLLMKNAMVLHSALVRTRYGGILFSGPSGIGKSTQAELWHNYQNAEILNGDRSIIRKTGNCWRAYGSPYAGSSRYFVNQSVPIAAIVVLKQADDCRIDRLNPVEAFFKIYAEMIVNTWNMEYVDKISTMIKVLIEEVPVYQLMCFPGQESIEVLREALKKEM